MISCEGLKRKGAHSGLGEGSWKMPEELVDSPVTCYPRPGTFSTVIWVIAERECYRAAVILQQRRLNRNSEPWTC